MTQFQLTKSRIFCPPSILYSTSNGLTVRLLNVRKKMFKNATTFRFPFSYTCMANKTTWRKQRNNKNSNEMFDVCAHLISGQSDLYWKTKRYWRPLLHPIAYIESATLSSFASKITHEWIQLPLKRVEYITISRHTYREYLWAHGRSEKETERLRVRGCAQHEERERESESEKKIHSFTHVHMHIPNVCAHKLRCVLQLHSPSDTLWACVCVCAVCMGVCSLSLFRALRHLYDVMLVCVRARVQQWFYGSMWKI